MTVKGAGLGMADGIAGQARNDGVKKPAMTGLGAVKPAMTVKGAVKPAMTGCLKTNTRQVKI